MKYPEHDGIVEIRKEGQERWTTALFYRNGKRPVFAQYGSDITEKVKEWRKPAHLIKKGNAR